MKKFIGTGVALVTPFKEDTSVDTIALTNIVKHVIDGGIDYLVVLGTTAENAVLTNDEKQEVIATVIKANNKRLPIILGIGGNNTAAVVHELKTSDLSDIDAILSVSPYYNKPTQEGIYQHFKAVAEATSKPIVVYNVPGRTASNILPETVIRLATDFDDYLTNGASWWRRCHFCTRSRISKRIFRNGTVGLGGKRCRSEQTSLPTYACN